jgi:hypothetical protein
MQHSQPLGPGNLYQLQSPPLPTPPQKTVAKSFVTKILHQLCHIKNNIQNDVKNRFNAE